MKITLALLCALGLAGAPRPMARADDAKITVERITDSRYSPADFGTSQLTVGLDIEAPAVAAARAIRGDVTSAKDDTGRQLSQTEKRDKWRELSVKSGPNKTRATVFLNADSPTRAARTLREVKGRVELYLPERDAKSIVTVAEIGQQAGQTLDDATLQTAELKITFLDKAQIERLQTELVEPIDDPKIRPALQLFARGLGRAMAAEIIKDGQPNPKTPVLRIEDPQRRLVEIAFETAQGEPLEDTGSIGFKNNRVYQFDQPLPADARLKIYVATSQSVVAVPFELKEIALP